MKKIKTAIHALLLAALAFTALPALNANDWDEQPSIKKSVAPDNPNKLEGMVMATINIDEKGFVVSAEIAKSTDAALDSNVLDAVKQWRFNPAKKGGSAIACKINVPFKFKG
ncbi:energy transducer TonB [Pelagicoccus sp. NFK12]|uniref:Energy transducer TonB n=1 Tax=Pelagicoccus enzymogenes TaxID=2773457 RepID=A0A927FDG6_9BACT|nr:energy transducer TonB [Pelagicoccus enzymogenes]MBD5782366.1 energy transducer TonB [Pelagicoccus enzymogenes]MDQ8199281.1 energy transducer TonB [Pelagicoccus enzymogenes]